MIVFEALYRLIHIKVGFVRLQELRFADIALLAHPLLKHF
jgi:hypothetical protein